MAVDPKDPNVVWVANGAGIQRTVDGGATFQTVMKVPGGAWVSIVIDPGNSSHVFAADYQHVYSTLDGGATWNVAASGQVNGLLATPQSILRGGPGDADAVSQPSWTLRFREFSSPHLSALWRVTSRLLWTRTAIRWLLALRRRRIFRSARTLSTTTFSSNAAGFAVKLKGDGSALLYSTFLGNFFPTGAAFDCGR